MNDPIVICALLPSLIATIILFTRTSFFEKFPNVWGTLTTIATVLTFLIVALYYKFKTINPDELKL